MSRRRKILILALGLFAVFMAGAGAISISLQNKIAQRLAKGWVIPPLELYTQGFNLQVGRMLPLAELQEELTRRGLHAGRDFRLGKGTDCGEAIADPTKNCLSLKPGEGQLEPLTLAWDDERILLEIWRGDPRVSVVSQSLFPRLITQFYDGQPILQQNTPLSEVPLACLQAVTAIEDRDFLEHGGVSVTGILRAIVRNALARRWAEGGSTITQQLVKNFFLTAKKTIRRKVEEQWLAVMLESQLNKDQILEMYLNVIYMGQNGPYQVRGFASASQYYFDKSINNLSLSECALLAALINNPGRYSPFTHESQALARRELVLHKMQDAHMIDTGELENAKAMHLPRTPEADRRAHAPYFVMGALKEYTKLGLQTEEGARLYTTLDPQLQNLATEAIQAKLSSIEARIRHPGKTPLQVALVTVDLHSAEIVAMVGGRDFRTTQFNRAVDSRRQIGSTVKPFVYWPALQTHDALTPVLDEPFVWKTGGQSWQPKNFERTKGGEVPYFYALAHSLNIPAARVGQETGLAQVADTLRRAGIEENIPELPSLTLGALELSPLEVAQAYSTLGRMGAGDRVHTLVRVEDLKSNVLFSHQPEAGIALEPTPTAQLIGMMEQSLIVGTARSAGLLGLTGALAGKTGTTSDTKDAWFAGFGPRLLTVVWVGYDDNAAMGLTGAGAALPIWIEFTKRAKELFVEEDFHWPNEVAVKAVSRAAVMDKFPNLSEQEFPQAFNLVMKKD